MPTLRVTASTTRGWPHLAATLAVVVLAGCSSGDAGPSAVAFAFIGPVVAADLSTPLREAAPPVDLGGDEAQDVLATACSQGTLRSCDDLYQRGAVGSPYEQYARSCGGRLVPSPIPGVAPNCRLRGVTDAPPAAGAPAAADSPTLNALAQRCSTADGLEICDDLYRASDPHTVYESYGTTCGGRTADTRPNACVGFNGVPDGKPLGDLGDDPELDSLANECFGARMSSCDELYASSDRGSVYETYAESCGGRLAVPVDRAQPTCDLRFNDPVITHDVTAPGEFGNSSVLDGLAGACGGGAMASCDELYARSDLATGYEDFGATCGTRFAAQRADLQFSAAGECEARVFFVAPDAA